MYWVLHLALSYLASLLSRVMSIPAFDLASIHPSFEEQQRKYEKDGSERSASSVFLDEREAKGIEWGREKR